VHGVVVALHAGLGASDLEGGFWCPWQLVVLKLEKMEAATGGGGFSLGLVVRGTSGGDSGFPRGVALTSQAGPLRQNVADGGDVANVGHGGWRGDGEFFVGALEERGVGPKSGLAPNGLGSHEEIDVVLVGAWARVPLVA
jgi:hypothetical protein